MRPATDRCPGVLRAFAAADGALIRLRRPGGRLATSVLSGLVAAAQEWGTPFLHLTSRANLQLRGLPDPLPASFVDAVAGLGLLPSPTHERVRNIVASPWSAHAGEMRRLVGEVDERLCASPELARLPGRFLVVVDDGSRHLLELPYDLGYLRTAPGEGVLLAAGGWSRPVSAPEAAAAVIRVATHFARLRAAGDDAARRAWQVSELPPTCDLFDGFRRTAPVPAPPPVSGELDGDLVVTVPLGRLDAAQAEALSRVTDEVVLTPWRQLVLPGAAGITSRRLASRRLREAGLICEAGTGWEGLTACVGAPYCRRTTLRTGLLAAQIAGRRADLAGHPTRIHLSGCERHCGAPAQQHLDLTDPTDLQEALMTLNGTGVG